MTLYGVSTLISVITYLDTRGTRAQRILDVTTPSTPTTTPRRLALCHRVTLDSVAHRWVPARTPTPRQGRPWGAQRDSHETTNDKRQQDTDQSQDKRAFSNKYRHALGILHMKRKGNENNCIAKSMNVATYAKRFPSGCWSFLDFVVRKSGMALTSASQLVNGIELLQLWRSISLKAGILFFQATSPMGRGKLKSKGGGQTTIHHNRSEETVELIHRTITSLNQLSIYGALADLCKELDPDYADTEICEFLVIPTEIANTNTTSQSSQSTQWNLLQDCNKKFAELPEDQKL